MDAAGAQNLAGGQEDDDVEELEIDLENEDVGIGRFGSI